MKLPDKPPPWESLFQEDTNKLLKVINDDDFREQAFDFNKRYLYWSEVSHRIDDRAKLRQLWAFMKMLRSDRYEPIPIKSIIMKYSPLSEFNRKLHHFDKFLAGNIEIQTKSLGLQKRYLISSLMEEAIASSMIEGASTTRKVAKEMLRQKRKPKTKSEKMIANNYETMQYILTQTNTKITPELLLEIQRKVTQDTLDDPEDEGRFRNTDEITVGPITNPEIIAYIPPAHIKIRELIDEFCKFANTESEDFIHPILKGIVLHFLLGYIHPFNDGNGRTARSVFYWYMLSRGYWLFEYMAVSKRIVRSRTNYDLAYLYTEYDEMDVTYFIKYIITCIDDSLKSLLGYIRIKQGEQDEINKILQNNPELNLRQAMIMEEFTKNPNKLFTIREISQTYKVVYQTARTDLLLLIEKKLINKKISGKTFVLSYGV